MTKLKTLRLFLVLLIFHSVFFSQAQNWPSWRGPLGDGTSVETNLPTQWDSVTNVVWKSPVPGSGHSSPIVWEDKLFTLTAFPETQERALLCYNSKNGDLLWQKTVIKAELEGKHGDNSYASGTPATDGKLIYVSVLDGDEVVVAAYNFSGEQVWMQRPGKFSSPHGFSCSPALFEGKVIINGSSKGDSFLAALNKSTGEILWTVSQEKPAHSFSTPIFREMAGKTQMIIGGNKEISSYNPKNGEKYWFIDGPSEDFCSSPVYNEKNGLVIMSSAWPQRVIMAIKPDGLGNVTESHVLWQTKEGAFYVPSPVATDDYLFTTMTNGRVHCIEITTGNTLWIEEMGKQYSSPVIADGLVYMPNDEGVVTVFKPGPTFELVAKNPIGEVMNASPAISNGKIYLRGDKHLFCIGENSSGTRNKGKIVPFSELHFADVGVATKEGKVTNNTSEINIVAGGADIWGTKDEFGFAYKKLKGDFDVSVQIKGLTKAHQYTKAGIMARADLSDNSPHVYFQVFPDNTPRNKNNGGCEFQYRLEKGGQMKAIYPSVETAGNQFDVNFPNTWIRLKREGANFESYISADNKTWNLYSSYKQELPDELWVGLAVTSHNSDKLTTAEFANFQLVE
ncbi:PQQ-binding-like beta-propeller repeat protein [Prolixibacteraceae bacterium Z1-6]|uniref:PQQ-binding-like beta-propeller repeat protein n=1 Tax=Draconibacterium aestuarii TaxID=2998507 RepID=A0A9X3FEF1_9BACT|nr:PQQ-binding-like beta-propeller repeat protein [Prolixibacteraceae bacterium Z1-6]